MQIYLSIYLSLSLSVCLSIDLSIYLSVCLLLPLLLPLLLLRLLRRLLRLRFLYSSAPLLLPPFFPKYYLVVPVANDIACLQHYRRLQLLVTGRTLCTDRLVLIWYAFHWWFKRALATQAASDLRLCLRLFFSQAST